MSFGGLLQILTWPPPMHPLLPPYHIQQTKEKCVIKMKVVFDQGNDTLPKNTKRKKNSLHFYKKCSNDTYSAGMAMVLIPAAVMVLGSN